MKIAIIFETAHSGGGSFTHSLNTSLDLIKFLGKNKKFVIYTQLEKNIEIFKKLKMPSALFKHTLIDKIIIYLSVYSFFRTLFTILNLKISIEKKIHRDKFDLIYFPVLSKTVFCLKKIQYVSTLLDLEHFQHSIFPEITKKEYKFRENLYFHSLPKSLLVITSSEIIKKNICNHYKIDKKKVVVVPYTPGRFFKNRKKEKEKIFKKKYNNYKNYFFYPAQIWGHKNHIVILKAAKILKNSEYKINFVFSGKNRGYQNILEEYIKKNNLKNIYFPGFISSEEMNYLYENCKGVIFTSLFGPNAIPPLEAWSYKKPLIYNDKLQDDVTKGTAYLVNIKNPQSVANAIIKILIKKNTKKFISSGYKKLNLIKKNNKSRYIFFGKKLDSLFI